MCLYSICHNHHHANFIKQQLIAVFVDINIHSHILDHTCYQFYDLNLYMYVCVCVLAALESSLQS